MARQELKGKLVDKAAFDQVAIEVARLTELLKGIEATMRASLKDPLAALRKDIDAKPTLDPAAIMSLCDRLRVVEERLKTSNPQYASACWDPELDDADAVTAALDSPASSLPAKFPPLVPLPAHGQTSASLQVTLTSSTTILTEGFTPITSIDDAGNMTWAGTPGYLRTRLKASTGFDLPINPKNIDSTMPCIKLVLQDIRRPRGAIIRPEGHSIVTGKTGVVIRAPTKAGLFYGAQTLLQLLPSKIYSSTVQATNWTVPRSQDRRLAALHLSRHHARCSAPLLQRRRGKALHR